MSDAATNDDAEPEDFSDDLEPEKKKLSGKKIVIFFVLPLILLGGAGAGIMMSGLLGDSKSATEETKKAENPGTLRTVFYDLPEMLVNLNSIGRRPNYLKMQVSLEIGSDVDVTKLRDLGPRIVDNFQIYLRELRVDDLRGSAGLYRLREELLARVNVTVQPIKVKDVLFKEFLVQ